MRYIGVDYGKKKIGIAISDEFGKIAFPKQIILNSKEAPSVIGELALFLKTKEIIVGESRDFSGKDNPIMSEVREFVDKLKDIADVEVRYYPEYLSSAEARRINEDKEDDARAAAIVLQSYLDNINNN